MQKPSKPDLSLLTFPDEGFTRGPGGGSGGSMDQRVTRLEVKLDALSKSVDERFDAVDKRFDAVDKRFDRLEDKIDKLPNEWAMAKVVFLTVGALMAAAIFAPRLLTMLSL